MSSTRAFASLRMRLLTHVAWLQPRAWVASDDEDALWPLEVHRDQVVLTDSCAGMKEAATIDRLHTVLTGNFGRRHLA